MENGLELLILLPPCPLMAGFTGNSVYEAVCAESKAMYCVPTPGLSYFLVPPAGHIAMIP